MTSLRADDVSVTYSIFSPSGWSLKNQIMSQVTGGRLGKSDAHHAIVQALDHVTLDIREGDRVGLIGHNGAGKSTLLRVLAGVYEPESGAVEAQGRIASMFDITLGLDPESTGYENIMLMGLFQGLGIDEINAQMHEIGDYAELGDFLSMPVRAYSSGMMMRLAFAVATSGQPDIVLMDEWIGTGDINFLNKAERRLHGLIGKAGILVMASHSDQIIRDVCNKAVLLKQGRVLMQGSVDEVLDAYRQDEG